MNQAEIELASTLLNIYKKNLLFLKQYYQSVYDDVEKLSGEINQGIYLPKYSLEYVDGYFDILNLQDTTWYYGTNSYCDADERANNANFSKDGSLDLLRKCIDGVSLANGENAEGAMPIIEYINNHVDFANIEFKKFFKFVFIGCGLSVHIHSIYKKLQPLTTLIFESDLEIFRLSLFITDYSEFQKNDHKLFLCIGGSRDSRIRAFDEFYGYHNYTNYNIKHHLLVESDRYILNEMIDYFEINTPTSFSYQKIINNISKIVDFAKNGYKFLDFNKAVEKKILKNKKVLLIAAGPSLDGYIDWIERYQDRFVIVCVDVILRKLEKHKITPDIIFSIDPSYLCAQYLTVDNNSFLDSTAIVFLAQQHPDVLKVVKKPNTFISQSVPLIEELGYFGSLSNVGTYAYMMSIRLGANEIYTIGNDAAFHQETGNRYATDSSCLQNENLSILSYDNRISKTDILEVKGNLRDSVKTNRSLLVFKDSFETATYDLRNEYNFVAYNLSDGVYLDGFIPMSTRDMGKKVMDFGEKHCNILSLLDSISQKILPSQIDFNQDKNVIDDMISNVEKHKKLKFINLDQLLEKKLYLITSILQKSQTMKITVFWKVVMLYIELVDIYINFLFNLKQKNIHDKKHLKQINSMWCDGLLDVLRSFGSIASKRNP